MLHVSCCTFVLLLLLFPQAPAIPSPPSPCRLPPNALALCRCRGRDQAGVGEAGVGGMARRLVRGRGPRLVCPVLPSEKSPRARRPTFTPKIPRKYQKIPEKYQKCPFRVFFGILGVFFGVPEFLRGYFFGIFGGNSGSGHLGAL